MSDTDQITKLLKQWDIDDDAVTAKMARMQGDRTGRVYYFAGTMMGFLQVIAADHHGCRRKQTCMTCLAIRSALAEIAADNRLTQLEAERRGRS